MKYVTDSFTVHFERRSDQFLLILFNPMHWQDEAEPYWGYSVAAKNGCSVLAFRSSSENWYPAKDMLAVLPKLNEILKKFSKIITYGHSMGGYAALKYARLLNATSSIAFSPQASIAPHDVGQFDKRFVKHYKEELHGSMLISPKDMAESAYVVYDPNFKADALNVQLFRNPSVKEVRLYNISHSTIITLAKSRKFLEVINHVLNDSSALAVKELLNPFRRQVPAYFSSLCANSLKRKKWKSAQTLATLGLSINSEDIELLRKKATALAGAGDLEGAFNLIENINLPAVLDQAGTLLMRLDRPLEAVNYFERAIREKSEVLYLRHLASAHDVLGETELVQFYLGKAISFEPRDPHACAQLAAFYLRKKMLEEARKSILSAIHIDSSNSYFFHLLSLILEEQNEFLLAILSAEKSVNLGAKNHIGRLQTLKKSHLLQT